MKKYAVIAFILSVVTLLNDVNGEDYLAVLDNIESEGLVLSSYKSSWYNFLVMPLLGLIGEAKGTMLALKLITVVFFGYVSINRENSLYLLLIFALILCLELFADNYNEFLRQSHALLLFLFGLRYSRIIRMILWCLAGLIHLVCVPIIGIFFVLSIVVRDWSDVDGRIFTLVYLLSPIFIFLSLFIETSIPGLSGNRTNFFAIIMLLAYSGLHLYNFLCDKGILTALMFGLSLSVLIGYSLLTDFGRLVSLLLFLHMGIVLHFKSQKIITINLISCLLISVVFYLV